MRIYLVDPLRSVWVTVRTGSSLVNATCATPGTSMSCVDKSAICALRLVTTDPASPYTLRQQPSLMG